MGQACPFDSPSLKDRITAPVETPLLPPLRAAPPSPSRRCPWFTEKRRGPREGERGRTTSTKSRGGAAVVLLYRRR
ncbi:hypothetical protein PIB30_105753, partial [Stylosanthes scabra]|nr:hypothetical protein [Stylosanthes scabra]